MLEKKDLKEQENLDTIQKVIIQEKRIKTLKNELDKEKKDNLLMKRWRIETINSSIEEKIK